MGVGQGMSNCGQHCRGDRRVRQWPPSRTGMRSSSLSYRAPFPYDRGSFKDRRLLRWGSGTKKGVTGMWVQPQQVKGQIVLCTGCELDASPNHKGSLWPSSPTMLQTRLNRCPNITANIPMRISLWQRFTSFPVVKTNSGLHCPDRNTLLTVSCHREGGVCVNVLTQPFWICIGIFSKSDKPGICLRFFFPLRATWVNIQLHNIQTSKDFVYTFYTV